MAAGWSPKSNAALTRERDLEYRVRQLLAQREGIRVHRFERCMHEDDRVVALFLVETLTGEKAMTAFIYADGQIEIVPGTFAA